MTARVVYLRRHPVLTPERAMRAQPEPAPEFWWAHNPAVQLGMGAIIVGAFALLMAWELGAFVVDAVIGHRPKGGR